MLPLSLVGLDQKLICRSKKAAMAPSKNGANFSTFLASSPTPAVDVDVSVYVHVYVYVCLELAK